MLGCALPTQRMLRTLSARRGPAAAARTVSMPIFASSTSAASSSGSESASTSQPTKRVIFVMGGPGSGKGTQCERLERDYDLAFFSAGELLRGVIRSGSEEGKRLQAIILEGKIVPSQVTVGLLQRAIAQTPKQTVLIDGFPRNMENWEVWQQLAGRDCDMAIYFQCPEEVMLSRLLQRNSGRADDNEETIKKRVQGFASQTLPVVELYRQKNMLRTFDTNQAIDAVYQELRAVMDSTSGSSTRQAVPA